MALRTGIERLAEDHENARHLGAALAAYDEFVLTPVQSNIVMLDISASGRSSEWFEQQLAPLGLLAKGMGKDHLRLTTYAHQTVRVDADIVIPPGGMVMITSPHGVAGAVKVRKPLPDGTLRCKPHKKKDKV